MDTAITETHIFKYNRHVFFKEKNVFLILVKVRDYVII